jgi:dTDP-glucose 4,6-dehydratase
MDTSLLRGLGWRPEIPFLDGLRSTVDWYCHNDWWWRPIKQDSQSYRSYYQQQYGQQ